MAANKEIRVLDATLRDGGLVNDFHFPDSFAKAVYQANVAAGVDYMEFGYRGDKKQYDPQKLGKWKFSSDDDIRSVIGSEHAELKVSIMTDVGRTDYKNDLRPKSESPVDLVRVTTYIHQMPEALEMIEYADKLGYEVSCNIMAISACEKERILSALKELAKTPVQAAYIVDSFGALYPRQIRELMEMFSGEMVPAGKAVGIHTHNNQQCAFANTLEAMDMGALFLDGTIYGMGRGAGNCHLEALLGYLSNEKYKPGPILDLVRDQMLGLKKQGTDWGYNTSYLITGLANKHPRDAIAWSKANDTDYKAQYERLISK